MKKEPFSDGNTPVSISQPQVRSGNIVMTRIVPSDLLDNAYRAPLHDMEYRRMISEMAPYDIRGALLVNVFNIKNSLPVPLLSCIPQNI